MHLEEPRARIGHRGSAITRAKAVALKALIVVVGAVTVASAFVLSLVFVAIGAVIVLTLGGYLWWKTRELRKQMRARMQAQQERWESPTGQIIEGEVVSRDPPRR